MDSKSPRKCHFAKPVPTCRNLFDPLVAGCVGVKHGFKVLGLAGARPTESVPNSTDFINWNLLMSLQLPLNSERWDVLGSLKAE